MKKLLNTLFVTTPGSQLLKERETVVVKVEGEVKLRIPIHIIESIVCFGVTSCSSYLMGFCGERNIGISFLSENGRFLARVEGPVSGNILLRREQFRRADDNEFCCEIAKAFIAGKITNCRTVLLRATRDHADKPGIEEIREASNKLKTNLQLLKNQRELDKIRGIEGDSANIYFSVFEHLITSDKKHFFFHGRNRRPPRDNMNALLSFIYVLLMHDIVSALEGVGLDPAMGFFHKARSGRYSLALDMMEEFRPILADRLSLSLVNLQQIKSKGFKQTESGAVTMSDATRKKVLIAYQERKKTKITHTFIDEQVQLGLLPYIQAMLLARMLRGDLDGYPPFVWR